MGKIKGWEKRIIFFNNKYGNNINFSENDMIYIFSTNNIKGQESRYIERVHAIWKKNTIKKQSLTIESTYVPRGSGNNPYGGKTDLHYKIKEWGFIFPTKSEAEKYANTHIEKNGIIVKKN